MKSLVAIFGFLMLFGALAQPGAAQGQFPGTTVCKTYFSSEKSAKPPGISAFFKDAVEVAQMGFFPPGPFALEYCTFNGKPSRYTLQSAAWKEGSVCVIRETDEMPSFAEDGKYLGLETLRRNDAFQNELMLVTEGACPRQDDPRYIWVSNVSPGVFRDVMNAWKRASASEKTLVAAAQIPKADKNSAELWDAFRDLMTGRYKYDPFLLTLPGRAQKRPPQIKSLDFGGLSGNAVAAGPFYTLVFDDPSSESAGWHLAIDMTPGGWKIVRVDRLFI